MNNLMTLREAKERLNISAATLRRLLAKGAISCYRVGLRIMFSDEQIAEYLKSVEILRAHGQASHDSRRATNEAI